MAIKPSQLSLVCLLLKARKATQRGFTLIELLVALVVGSLILGSLLYLVVELMQVNRREEVLGQTQQDMQRAIDYITRDAREAVFVYSTPGAIVDGTATLLEQLDGIPTDAVPILAFWRLDPVEAENDFWDIEDCEDEFTNQDKRNECNTLKLRQSYYTLVVYLQQANAEEDLWGGPSRIIRYELPKYSTNDIAALTQRTGYSDPTGCGGFANWTRPDSDCAPDNVGTTEPNIAVLTDYVNFDGSAEDSVTCPAGYIQEPPNPSGFHVCISNTAANSDNRTIRVFLQGNATAGRPGLITANSEAGRLPTLESEILVRGVLDRQPPGTTDD
ncbi:MAG: prepilin-type N-terminal cleavage/methylation domain-containing protein [Leptolyngbyaceae cyanobacterium SM2_5_2]|nr:prepilin-type N-terminal cleavage/methylation domain-containing protein [Leptolyngbyaceae cyanobacterium SM2_5_2]